MIQIDPWREILCCPHCGNTHLVHPTADANRSHRVAIWCDSCCVVVAHLERQWFGRPIVDDHTPPSGVPRA